MTFPSGVMRTTIDVPIENDKTLEGNETFNIRINIGTLFPKDVLINVGTIGSTTITIVDTTGEYSICTVFF